MLGMIYCCQNSGLFFIEVKQGGWGYSLIVLPFNHFILIPIFCIFFILNKLTHERVIRIRNHWTVYNYICFFIKFLNEVSREEITYNIIHSLFSTVILNICQDFQLNFHAMYACVGLWNSLFLIIFSIFDVSRIMKWSTR